MLLILSEDKFLIVKPSKLKSDDIDLKSLISSLIMLNGSKMEIWYQEITKIA